VVKNWVAWTQWLLGVGVPAAHMVRSSRSVDKGEREEFSLPGFACSTAALLALLCRWEVTLAGEKAKAAARDLRKAWVQHFFTGRAWVWPVPEDLQANWTGLRQVDALVRPKSDLDQKAGMFVARLVARPAVLSKPPLSKVRLRFCSPSGSKANDLMLSVANGVVDLSNALQQHSCLKRLYNLPRRGGAWVEAGCRRILAVCCWFGSGARIRSTPEDGRREGGGGRQAHLESGPV
jgi:hypothetical protein